MKKQHLQEKKIRHNFTDQNVTLRSFCWKVLVFTKCFLQLTFVNLVKTRKIRNLKQWLFYFVSGTPCCWKCYFFTDFFLSAHYTYSQSLSTKFRNYFMENTLNLIPLIYLWGLVRHWRELCRYTMIVVSKWFKSVLNF